MYEASQLNWWIELVSRQDPAVGLLLLAVGLCLIIYGWRIHKLIVGASFACVGGVLGITLAPPEGGGWWIYVLAGGVGLAAASQYVLKVAVPILGGLAAGLYALATLQKMGLSFETSGVAGIVVLIAVGSLGFMMLKEVMSFVSSLEGSLLLLGGLMVFVSADAVWWGHLRSALLQNPILLPFAILPGTVTGYYVQTSQLREIQAGRGD